MLTEQTLKSIINYDSLTGEFTWIITRSGMRPDKSAGSLDKNGYLIITINGKRYKAHRLAWLYTYGAFPESRIDHHDRNKSNNKLSNLRLATASQNGINKLLLKSNKSGYTGVYYKKEISKFVALIRHNKRLYHLGCFPCAESAACVRMAAEIELFGNFTPIRN